MKRCRQLCGIWTLLLWVLTASAFAAPPPSNDIRIVIDVSGSMKKNDPHNLRAPALQLLVKLIPGDAQAGVWLFSTETQRVVPPGAVNSAWRARASQASARIDSRGLFTNIGKALTAASKDWEEADDHTPPRNIIFLTDGLVDVAKDPQKNREAREHIINDILPRLKAQRAQVIAIALSKDADIPLLQKLALTSGGWFQLAESSAALEKMFFKAFEKAVPRDTVPLKGNEFQIDASVSEFTLLAFRKDGIEQTAELMAPDGSKSSPKHSQKGVSWFSQAGYDLITATKPAPGTWKLLADLDPDNRVMIVTDLAVKTNKLPNNLALGETFSLQTWLTEKGNPITRPDFLKLVTIDAKQQITGDKEHSWSLADNGVGADDKEDDGIYTLALDETLSAGDHVLTLNIDGKTFQREQHYNFHVHATPVTLDATLDEHAAHRSYIISSKPNADLINLQTAKIGVTVKSPSGQKSDLALTPADGGVFTAKLSELEPAGDYTLTLNLKGTTHDERPIKLTLDPLTLSPPAAKEPEPEHKPAAHESEHHEEVPEEEHPSDEAPAEEDHAQEEHDQEEDAAEEEPSDEHETTEEEEEAHEEETEESEEPAHPAEETPPNPRMQWIIAISLLVGVNVLILVACIFGYKAWKKKQLNSLPQLSAAEQPAEKGADHGS